MPDPHSHEKGLDRHERTQGAIPPPYRRALILGLDALGWPVVESWIEAGAMPFLGALRKQGHRGALRSTLPHQTPAAWTTFMTGVQPGTHGIVNWERFDPLEQTECLHDMGRLEGKTIYHHVSRAGLKAGVAMQPMTYPPFELNGYVLSGFDGPGLDAPFAWPRELEREILERCPEHGKNLNPDTEWREEGHEADDAVFCANLDLLIERTRRTARLATDLQRAHPTDVWMVYFHDPDLVMHRAWRWSVPEGVRENPRRHAKVLEYARALDEACRVCDEAMPSEGRLTLALSDHGQRADRLRVRLNSVLMDLGLLVPASRLGLLKDFFRRLTDKAKRKGVGLPIDWARTKAFMPFQACTGFVYVNLKGRQPFGSVEPADYEKVRDETIEALRGYADPRTGERYFEAVGATDGLFKRKDALKLPDIYVQPNPGVEFVRRAKRGEAAFPTKRAYAGLHDPEGLYVLSGAGVKPGESPAHICDLAPTLLACLGVDVPSYMEGSALGRCFEAGLQVKTRPADWEEDESTGTPGYTAAQQAEIESRLSNLGYLD
ncbi:MAG: alkaline phosphatase family protein [Planctomycetota bacterium]|nr:alkaline phosphatase family protein [Planctomycetota bacterium]